MFDSDILDEKLTVVSDELKAYVDNRIVEAIINKKSQVNQRPDMFWRQIKLILSEEKPDTPTRLMTFLATFAKDNDIQDGEEIHQLAGNIYKRYYC